MNILYFPHLLYIISDGCILPEYCLLIVVFVNGFEVCVECDFSVLGDEKSFGNFCFMAFNHRITTASISKLLVGQHVH